MRLKSLELQGFKSFPDTTKINIEHGMTVIVGPNGSGKSNISDAIRWVLGEISSKNIRGNKMEDVIFGGTDSRRPMGFAKVSLTFDNTEGEIPLPLDYDEVTVTRKFFRAGYSEYSINGKTVRLKDINELFMNTGLGKSGYSIIGQGRIAEIISKKSEDRRGIFEEASGISKYRYQKTDAEKKLAETEENLDRVTDILSELEGRVGPLEKDAAKARKYLELYEQKKEIDIRLWLFEIESIRTQTETLQKEFEIAKHSLEMADDSLQSLESQSEKLLLASQEARVKAEEQRRLLTEFTEKKHEAESSELLFQRDIEHLEEERKRLLSELQAQIGQGVAAAEKLESIGHTLEQAETVTASIDREMQENERLLEEIRDRLQKDNEEKEERIHRLDALRTQTIQRQLERSTLTGTGESTSARRLELENNAAELSERIRAAGDRSLRSEKTLGEYRAKIEDIQKIDREMQKQIDTLSEKKAALIAESDAITVDTGATAQRMEALKRMEEHFDGYAGSVRYVMQKAAGGALNGICGPVSKLLSVESRYALAIETVLGGNIQNIVVEDEESAKRAIALLKAEKAGRATFYPLSIMKGEKLPLDIRELSQMSGYLGFANDLVGFDAKYRGVMEYLLCRSVICTDIDAAAAISKRFGYKFRTVTLDGQVINAGGSFTGGSTKRDSGILSRSAEIAKLKADLKDKENRKQTLSANIQVLEKEITEKDSQRLSATGSLDILRVMQNAEDTQQKILLAQIDSDKGQLQKIHEALNGLDEQTESYRLAMTELENTIAGLEKQTSAEEAALSKLEQEETVHQNQLSRAIEAKNALLLKQGAAKRDEELLYRDLQAAQELAAAAKQGEDRLREGLRQIEERNQKANRTRKENHSELQKLTQQILSLEGEEGKLRTAGEDYEKKLEQIREQQREKQREREIFFRDATKLETRLSAVTSEQDKYAAKLWDEYELTYTAAVILGYPKLAGENRIPLLSEQTKLRGQIKALGHVNVGAIDEYTEVKQRFDFLSGQYKDLTEAKNDLGGIIFRLEKEMRIRFEETFTAINEHFKLVFAELFGGGTAELKLTDPDHPLECGIEIGVAPPGKIIKSLSLLSGGEQVFVAIALFFAILKVTPAPFCLLDEIEAALDEVNVAKFAAYAKRFSDKTQFIIITHRRGTMEEADELYGVTMQERGISRVLSLSVGEVEAKLGEKLH